MSIIQELLLQTLRSALTDNGLIKELDPVVFDELMQLAEEQTVAGFVFDILSKQNCQIGFQKIREYVGKQKSIEQNNHIIDTALTEFCNKCEKENEEYIVVKGQTIAALYPKPSYRQPGDIDFLVKETQNAHSFSRIFPEVSFPEKFVEKEFAFEYHGIIYELHTNLVHYGCKNHQMYWNGLMTEAWSKSNFVIIRNQKVRVLSPTLNAAYVFIHLFFHFIREGVALRQFCDWAMVLHYYKDEIDREKLYTILSGVDMVKAYKAFGMVLVDELGLPEEEFPFKLVDTDLRWKDSILKSVFYGGNFGKNIHKTKSVFLFKMETFIMMVKNCFTYYCLAPCELSMMIPKTIELNLRLVGSRISGKLSKP